MLLVKKYCHYTPPEIYYQIIDFPVELEQPPQILVPETPACSKCSKHYIANKSKEAEIIEVEVKAYTRKML